MEEELKLSGLEQSVELICPECGVISSPICGELLCFECGQELISLEKYDEIYGVEMADMN